MIEIRKEHKKVSFNEEDASTLLQRYEPTVLLTLLQEVEYHADLKIDWNELVKKTATGITNAREYQMLWRHLAYQDDLLDEFEDGALPLDDDSDLECELEAFPAPSTEASTEAEACVKVMIDSRIQNESDILNGSTIEAPLTINIPGGHLPSSSESLQPSWSMQDKSIIVPVTVQRFPLPSVPLMENFEANGSSGGNNISLKRKRKWSEDEDRQLMDAVKKWGEGNWAVIINKGEYDWGGRQSSHLSQRWATLRKKNTNLSVGKSSSQPKITEAQIATQIATRHAITVALDNPSKSLKAIGISGHVSTKPVLSNPAVETSAGGFGPGHLSKEGHTMPKPLAAVKSQPSSKNTIKSNLGPDSAVGVTADGICVTLPSVAAANLMSLSQSVPLTGAVEVKNAVDVLPTCGSSVKSSMPASGALQSETRPDQHCAGTSQTTEPFSSHAATFCMPAASLDSPSKASLPAVSGTSTHVEVPKLEPRDEVIGMTSEFPLKQEVSSVQGKESYEPGCAPKEQMQGDGLSKSENAESEIIPESKAAIASLGAESRSEVVEESSLNLEKPESNLAASDNDVVAAEVKNSNDSKMLPAVDCGVQNLNEKQASLPCIALDKCNAK